MTSRKSKAQILAFCYMLGGLKVLSPGVDSIHSTSHWISRRHNTDYFFRDRLGLRGEDIEFRPL